MSYTQKEDIYYIKAVCAGNIDAFSILLDRYSVLVYNLVYKIVGHKEDAEELTQDVFMKVFEALPKFHGDASFSTWIYRIAYNTAISAFRKAKQDKLVFDDALIESTSEYLVDDYFGSDSNEELLALMDKAMSLLLVDERALIALFYLEGHSVEEVASIMTLSVSNVKVRLHRVRKKLFVIMQNLNE
ncbi:MAG TPA: RNA polymerase subunit sigma-70 [Porphyromonadaceae bacterium]|nr:RNA polymerase subunit sigma-70 [Porphyromonadaceae bacterium]